MGKKLTPEERVRRAIEAGFDANSTQVSGERVLKKLEDSTNREYQNFIAQELHLHAAINRDISARDFVTLNHFRNLIQQLWKNDWYEFPFPIYRVYFSAFLKMCMYSTARVGEYLESTARRGSGRGLRVPQSHRLGRDSGLTGEILTATWADKGLAKLGRRAGYEKLISVHDMRAEGLVRTNENGHSMEELMQMAGHGGNPRIFFEHYMSSTSSVQGVSNILKLERRKDIAEPFRGLTLRRHPQLWQALPAKLQQDHLYNPCR
ncbi:hypothetical protein RJZ90_000952 [Blastomyces dermatitidis]